VASAAFKGCAGLAQDRPPGKRPRGYLLCPWSGRRAGGNINDLGGAAQRQRRQGSAKVALRDDLNSCAPRLCRYARALVTGQPGPSEIADDLVHAVLLRTWEAGPALRLAGRDLHLHLYTMLTEWYRERLVAGRMGGRAHMEKENFSAGRPRAAGTVLVPASPRDKFAAALLALALEEREALLLVVLEGFSYAQAAQILKISRTVLIMRLACARAALSEIPAPETPLRRAKTRPSYLRVVK
jgi:RNA polymerase sigma-70 factor (ECF subfamily)